MAEAKNAFIKSKMNKDLDSRLVPQGEYRDAVNVQVSKSEGADVGALENVLGNAKALNADFATDSGVEDIKCIGYFANEFNNTVYLFFTDYTDPYTAGTSTYNKDANNFIYSYNVLTNQKVKLVEGAFLNFSTNRPIIGINFLEDFLFFTDNRNQPRKINVSLAASQGITYYTSEDNISIAKYYPFKSINVYKLSNQSGATALAEVEGAVVDSTTVNLRPGFILGNIADGMVVTGNGIDDNVFVVSYTYPTVTLNKAQTIADQTALTFGNYETSMYDVYSDKLPDGTTDNPYYDEFFAGDTQYLEDKFIRFSYRFKFIDGEYSLLAPFTQPCFIPKQDGYFMLGDEQQAVASTIVSFMENKVNKIDLQIPLPSIADNLESDFHISEIDIIYKESDSLALQVVETIAVSEITGASDVYEYSYLSQKPYKTLPESEITRVYDKVPIKALGQEIVSNRIVYSNFQDKHTPPSGLNYQVNASEKLANNDTSSFAALSRIEYPNHSVKQNRNYQIGIVLADKFGRQSTTILSNNTSDLNGDFGADTVYLPYRNINDSIDFAGDSLKILFNEVISSIKNENTGTPGLYNGDVDDTEYNPTGWYSYKVVVKQTQQDYYNVYTAGALKGNPKDATEDLNASYITLTNDNINKIPRDLSEVGAQDKNYRSSVRLYGRVENTAAAFSNIGNEQYIPTNENLYFTVNTISDLFDLFVIDVSAYSIDNPNNIFHAFYKAESNPFVAEFITTQNASDQFGVTNPGSGAPTTYDTVKNLTIFETDPDVSRLDIYYETSTSGTILALNQAIGSDTGTGLKNFTYTHTEADAPSTVIANEFSFADPIGSTITPDFLPTITSVIDNSGSGINRASEFELVQGSTSTTYDLKTSSGSYFYYGSNGAVLESYTFTFSVTTGGETTSIQTQGALGNVNPSIDNDNSSTINVDNGTSSILTNITGKNGSNENNPNTSVYTQELTFSILSSTGPGVYTVVNNNEVRNSNSTASGFGSFTLRVRDAAGAVADKTFNVNFGQPFVDSDFTIGQKNLTDGDGYAVWFTDNTTSLETNLPGVLGNESTAWLVGFGAPNSTGQTDTNNVCSDGSPATTFENKTLTTGLTTGAFYVLVRGINSYIAGTSQYPNGTFVNIRYAIQYRASSSDPWSTAVDISNVSVNDAAKSGTWEFSNTKDGFDDNNNIFAYQGGIAINTKSLASPNLKVGGKLFAFATPGEYRIVVGNIQSNFGTFQLYADCNAAQQDSNSQALVDVNDFNYPTSQWAGDGDNVYEYRLSTNATSSCDETFTATTTPYYSNIPFAKYLTQLYTDQNLTVKASLTAGTKRFRRMLTRGNSLPSNPEATREGAYTATFSSTGAVTSISPCLY